MSKAEFERKQIARAAYTLRVLKRHVRAEEARLRSLGNEKIAPQGAPKGWDDSETGSSST